MSNKLSPSASSAIEFARLVACELGHTYIGSEHLLLALLSDKGDTDETSVIFEYLKINYTDILQRTVALFGRGERTSLTSRDMTPTLQGIIEKSGVWAKKYSGGALDTRHLAISLLSAAESVAVKIIEMTGVKRVKVLNLFLSSIENEKKLTPRSAEAKDARQESLAESKKLTPQLNKYGHDLVEMALNGKYSIVVGREKECDRVIRTLMRKGKNNPCLIGEPGVGKTAIAEGIAKRIADGAVPEALRCYRIVSLDVSTVVAGAKYRGDFEERIRVITDEVIKAGNVILFIDEVHNIVGAGSAEGAVDAANILKPHLARDEVKIIGATTLREYKKYIEKDSALERRFQPIVVSEPSKEETLEILKGIRKSYEEYHSVVICDEALKTAVELSSRFVPTRFFPDKAIDLMDETASRKRIEGGGVVTEKDVAASLSESLGIPLGRLQGTERERVYALVDKLKGYIVGQDKAVETLADAYLRSRLDLADRTRPRGAYVFVGETGVGKTELAKVFAEEVFGKNGFIRLDMTEFSEGHSVSKLIGSPPGYVGFDEGNSKLEVLRRHPYSVVLFDEIEKAHPDVINLLLQILDNGTLTDSQGRLIDFKNTVVILTSNTGVGKETKRVGFNEATHDDFAKDIEQTLKKKLSPELVSRLDEIIVFSALERCHLEKIAEICLEDFKKRCLNNGIELAWEMEVVGKIVDMTSRDSGARGIKNAVKKEVEAPVSRLALNSENSKILLTLQGNSIVTKATQPK